MQRLGKAMRRPNSGFTLVELMVTVVILAIIAAVALPIYTQYSRRTYRSEAMADLLNCAQGMERYAAVNFNYTGADLALAGGNICNPRSVAQGRYNITVVIPTADTFTLTADPQGTMANPDDGILTYDNAGQRGWDRNGNDTIDVGEANWDE